ncbi:MAG TPA: glycosyltransferase [Terriglobia bacterium]|nr:glycosyltransferase [Terriglobia bacterium]
METVRFSVLVPTMGRLSLTDTLRSIIQQPLMPGDEVLVIGDLNHGCNPGRDIMNEFGPQFFYYSCGGAKNAWGGPQRNLGLTVAKGSWLTYMDDDDLMAPYTLEIMRGLCANHTDRPIMTRMRWPDGKALESMVGGQCLWVPNVPYKVGFFGNEYCGDQTWIETTMSKYQPKKPLSVEVITCLYSGQHREG